MDTQDRSLYGEEKIGVWYDLCIFPNPVVLKYHFCLAGRWRLPYSCQELNMNLPCIRQVPYPLYYLFGSKAYYWNIVLPWTVFTYEPYFYCYHFVSCYVVLYLKVLRCYWWFSAGVFSQWCSGEQMVSGIKIRLPVCKTHTIAF